MQYFFAIFFDVFLSTFSFLIWKASTLSFSMFSYFSFRDFPIRCFPFRCFPPNPKLEYRCNIKSFSTVINNEISDEQQIIHYNSSVKYQAIGCSQSYAHLSKSTDRKIVSQHLSANGAQPSPRQRSTTVSKSVSSAPIQQSIKYSNIDQWKMVLSVCSVTATSSLSMTNPTRASIMVLAAAKEILMTHW